MPYATERKYIALGLETTRGQLADPSRYLPAGKASEFDFKVNLLPDDLLRGNFEQFPAVAGRKEGTGKLTATDVSPDVCGELIYSLLGDVNTTGPIGGIFTHVFSNIKNIIHPSYTFYVNRGISKKAYTTSVVRSLAFKGEGDGKLTLDADILFRDENTTTATLNPAWYEPNPFVFYEFSLKFNTDDEDLTSIKDWSLTIDNGTTAHNLLDNQQIANNILTAGKLQVSGSFTTYFESEDRRDDFLAGTSTALLIKCNKSVQNKSIQFSMPNIKYTAYPFQDVNGLLGATVNFNAYYSGTAKKTIEITLKNSITNYK